VSGPIKVLHADFNTQVRRGQVVAEVEPSLFEAQAKQAGASLVRLEAEVQRVSVQLQDAQQKLKRAQELAARHLIPATDLKAADTFVAAGDPDPRWRTYDPR
jgi:HlyD family secretion protein